VSRAALGAVVGVLAVWAAAPWIGPALAPDVAGFVLWELRLPRVVLGALAGAGLGATGAAFQALFENPLASESTIGTAAGASVGALVALLLAPMAGVVGVGAGAWVGAALATAAVARLAASRALSVEDVLVAGIAVTLASGAATTGLLLAADAVALQAAIRWSVGSVATIGYGDVAALVGPVAVGGAALVASRGALEVLALGHDRAGAVGVDVVRVRLVVLGAGSLVVAGVVAVCGPLALVGLVVPHLARGLVGGNPRRVVPWSAWLGAGFLPLCDVGARALGPEVPVGVVTAAVGAAGLVILLVRRRRSAC
jgi:ABC-type Fe3+-siderophore transport system permease subunit